MHYNGRPSRHRGVANDSYMTSSSNRYASAKRLRDFESFNPHQNVTDTDIKHRSEHEPSTGNFVTTRSFVENSPTSSFGIAFEEDNRVYTTYHNLQTGSNSQDRINKTVEQEKDILICEFKDLGSKLRKLKNSDTEMRGQSRERPPSSTRAPIRARPSSKNAADHRCIPENRLYESTRGAASSQCENSCNNHYGASYKSRDCCGELSECYHRCGHQHAQRGPACCCSVGLSDDRLKGGIKAGCSCQSSNVTKRENIEAKTESKAFFLKQLESQIAQIQEQIGKNEGILQRKRKEISHADEILENKKKYLSINEAAMQSSMRDASENSAETCTEACFCNSQQDRVRLEKKKFIAFVKETEIRLGNEQQHLAQSTEKLSRFEKELKSREQEIYVRQNELKATEDELESLAMKLEEQSQEVIEQKSELNDKIELFTSAHEKFQAEKREFVNYEKDFHRRNLELNAEKERLAEETKQARQEKHQCEQKVHEMSSKLKKMEQAKGVFDDQEHLALKRESALREQYEELQQEAQSFRAEKLNFQEMIRQEEQKLYEREQELLSKELQVNQSKAYYEDFELKLLGIKMNEELWQKKRGYEIENLSDDIKRLKEKEIVLAKKEEKLVRWEERLKKQNDRVTSSTQKGGHDKENLSPEVKASQCKRESTEPNQNFSFDPDLNEKYLLPLSHRSGLGGDNYSSNMSDLLK